PHGKRGPEWTQLTAEGYRLVPGPAATVRKIFELACAGYGVSRVTSWLEGHSDQHPPLGTSKAWNQTYVRNILRSRKAVGEYQPRVRDEKGRMVPDGEPVPGYYPAVVTEKEWLLAQDAINGRRGKMGRPGDKETNLFTGIVHEARTGERMSIDGQTKQGGRS